MKLWHHLLSISGAGISLIAFTTTWWQGTLVSGQTFRLSGTDSEPLAWSVSLAMGAAYVAALLLKGFARRCALGIQSLSALGAGWALLANSGAPTIALQSAIEGLTGIAGVDALALLDQVTGGGQEWVALGAAALAFLGGILGQFDTRGAPTRDRYSMGGGAAHPQDSQGAWDSLSEGVDPTTQ